jgi:protein pelota
MTLMATNTKHFFIELNQLTGIAAILTFPLDVDLVETEEKEAKEEAERAAAE